MIKRCLIIVACLIGLSFQKVSAQATITLSIDSMAITPPMLIGGFTDFIVRVRVDNSGSPDTVVGDIFYYYLTDQMIALSDTARIFEQEFFPETIYDGFIDTISIDIDPTEIHASPPMNLIVIWPAMINPEVLDTVSDSLEVMCEGYLGTPVLPEVSKGNIIFPCPAMTFLYIKPKEIDQISEMIITNMLGQQMQMIPGANLSEGWVNIDSLNPGSYIAILRYKDGSTATMRFLKE